MLRCRATASASSSAAPMARPGCTVWRRESRSAPTPAGTGRAALAPLVHAAALTRLALAPDGSKALTFDGRCLRVWDLTAGEPLAPDGPAGEEGAVPSPDGKRLARIQDDVVQLHDSAGK